MCGVKVSPHDIVLEGVAGHHSARANAGGVDAAGAAVGDGEVLQLCVGRGVEENAVARVVGDRTPGGPHRNIVGSRCDGESVGRGTAGGAVKTHRSARRSAGGRVDPQRSQRGRAADGLRECDRPGAGGQGEVFGAVNRATEGEVGIAGERGVGREREGATVGLCACRGDAATKRGGQGEEADGSPANGSGDGGRLDCRVDTQVCGERSRARKRKLLASPGAARDSHGRHATSGEWRCRQPRS